MLEIGKLDSDLLEKIVFEKIKFKREEVLTRPGIGEDCAVLDYGEYECILSTDPITASVNEIGSLAIHISCNDIASNGIEPIGILLAVLLPEGTSASDVEKIMEQAGEASQKLGVEIIGGHTEITTAVNQPVIVSTAVGRGKKGDSQRGEDMAKGDYILMTKTAGIEGTGIIASDFEEDLKDTLTEEEILYAKSLMSKVSVIKEGVIAGKIGTKGMHDITEGGILGAVWEMCHVGNVGAEIFIDQIPVEEVTEKICKKYNIDYLRLISSGCMLIISSPEKKDALIKALQSKDVEATVIGKIKNGSEGIKMVDKERRLPVAPPTGDEIYKVVGS